LNAGIHPVVPRTGSVGVGDLQVLAQVTLALMGEGEVEYQATIRPAAEALAAAGLAPLRLGIKDGIAMVGINAQSIGQGALVVADGIQAIGAIACAAALQFEAFGANLSPLDPRVQAARPSPCAPDAAAELLRLLAGSGLHEPDARRHVHDPLCFRSYAQVQGAARESLVRARALVQLELNNPGDNPLILRDTGEILHNSNFDIVALALAFETLGQALAHVASAACWRAYKLMSPNFTDLPRFLSPLGTNRSGYATSQKTLAALEAEIRHLANPVSLGALPVADGQEDVAQMAPAVVAKTKEIIARLRWIAAIGLSVGAQATELGKRQQLGLGAVAVFERVRALAPRLDDDRPLAPDYHALEAAIRAGQFVPPRA
jgi:histidine ammonia-lyase